MKHIGKTFSETLDYILSEHTTLPSTSSSSSTPSTSSTSTSTSSTSLSPSSTSLSPSSTIATENNQYKDIFLPDSYLSAQQTAPSVDQINEMITAGLPSVVGYQICPEEADSDSPWVTMRNVIVSNQPGQNNLGKLAVDCDNDEKCLGFSSYQNDGTLYKYKDNLNEMLVQSDKDYIPLYIKSSHFTSCQPNTSII